MNPVAVIRICRGVVCTALNNSAHRSSREPISFAKRTADHTLRRSSLVDRFDDSVEISGFRS